MPIPRESRGDSILYRARVAGLAKEEAEATCAFLKHADVDCMTIVISTPREPP
jgi:hypothetical protein